MIQLNGQAIVIMNDGVEINKWPYNCIRQFRAEDETGKFSFVSGRRGPYGVAEYNFKLHNDSLVDLQGALTEFTGAQFSAVAPGSGTEQQQLQPQQPLPPYPPTMSHASSSGSLGAYTTSIPRHMSAAGNRDSPPSNYPDSVFQSPSHTTNNTPPQGPRLPPRDYLLTSTSSNSSDHTFHLVGSADEQRTMTRGRTTNSAPMISGMSTEVGSNHLQRPAPPLPRREAKEPSPETWVAKSTSYEEARLNSQPQPASKPAPPIPKKKSLFGRFRGDEGKT